MEHDSFCSSCSDEWIMEEWVTVEEESLRTDLEELVSEKTALGDTDSWTTSIEFPSIQSDSTTTDDSYTSDTSRDSTSSSVWEEDFESGEEENETTATNVDRSASRTCMVSKKSTSLSTSDTDNVINQLTSLHSVRPRYVQMQLPKRPYKSPMLASSTSSRGRSAPVLVDRFCDNEHLTYEVPPLSPSWWQPIRSIRLGIPHGIHRNWKFSKEWKRKMKRRERARRWNTLYHVRVIMSTASWKQPRQMLHDFKNPHVDLGAGDWTEWYDC